MSDPANLYGALDVSMDADAATIKRAHRKAVKALHPDNSETGNREKFEVVQRAFLVLANPTHRRRYDETGAFNDSPDNAMTEITGMVIMAFDAAMTEIGDQFPHIDVVAHTRSHLKKRIAATKTKKAEITAGIKQIEHVLKRLKAPKTAFDPIGNSMRARIADANRAITAIEREAELAEQAIEFLANYGFNFTPPQPAYFSTTATSTRLY